MLSRVHFHSINLQAICHTWHWGDSRAALAKALIVSLQESLDRPPNDFAFTEETVYLDVPEELILPEEGSSEGRRVIFDIASPVNCWQMSTKFTCCAAPSLISRKPKKTCGLGDNISSAALVFHKTVEGKKEAS